MIGNYIRGLAGIPSYAIRALIGRAPQILKKEVLGFDRDYYNPTLNEFLDGLQEAHRIMRENGWVAKRYIKQSRDCDNFAIKMAVELGNAIVDQCELSGKGVKSGIVCYRKDDGRYHAIVFAELNDGKTVYVEPYVEYGLAMAHLSKTEIKSIYRKVTI